MQREIITDGIYHVLNRGVDKRKIFLDEEDYLRFVHDLFEFNDIESVNNLTYFFRNKFKNNGVVAPPRDISHSKIRPYVSQEDKKPRKLLVEILAFCLMPNHYHLMIKPKYDDGLFKFMKKLNMGYAKYFNEKYTRSGALFEGRYKSAIVRDDSYFIHLPYYIHLNPLDLEFPEWRIGKIENYESAIKFLENYRWSSFPDYIGKKNFPSVTQREFLLKFWGGSTQYKEEVSRWLKERDLEENRSLFLE